MMKSKSLKSGGPKCHETLSLLYIEKLQSKHHYSSLESSFREKLFNYLSDSGRQKISDVHKLNSEYFSRAFHKMSDKDASIQLLIDYSINMSELLNVQYQVEGPVDLTGGYVAIANHIGLGKIFEMRLNDFMTQLDIIASMSHPDFGEILNLESNFLRKFGIVNFLARRGFNLTRLFSVGIRYSWPFSEIYKSSNGISLSENGNFHLLSKSVSEEIESGVIGVLFFPEGRTSGKYNNGGVFGIDRFKSGAFLLAKRFNLPIIAFTQRFTPDLDLYVNVKVHTNRFDKDMIRNDMIGSLGKLGGEI